MLQYAATHCLGEPDTTIEPGQQRVNVLQKHVHESCPGAPLEGVTRTGHQEGDTPCSSPVGLEPQ